MTRPLPTLPAPSPLQAPARLRRALLGLLTAALVAAGCSTTDSPTGSGASPGGGTATETGTATWTGTAAEADITFATGMVPHHEQAVEMAELALERDGSGLHEFAEEVRAAQQPEIDQLRQWLADWDAAGTGHGAHEGHGMMSEQQMSQLRDASDEEFDRLWLEVMIEHHEGAVAMARDQLREGTHPGAREMARDIVAGQEAEIARMRGVLDGDGDAAPSTADRAAPLVLPESHVHGIEVDEEAGAVYLAAHDGLYRYDVGSPEGERVGPPQDLMGLTQAQGRLLASGHPGPGDDRPNPLGLVESTDGGRTWQELSRAGESDFHALTAGPDLVVGFDGRLRVSTDGRQWQDADLAEAVHDLAASSEGTVLATTAAGPYRATGDALSWERLEQAPVLVLVESAGAATWLGLAPDGSVHSSRDDGDTWERTGQVQAGGIQAMTVAGGHEEGQPATLLVVTDQDVVRSTDGGRTFQPLGR